MTQGIPLGALKQSSQECLEKCLETIYPQPISNVMPYLLLDVYALVGSLLAISDILLSAFYLCKLPHTN